MITFDDVSFAYQGGIPDGSEPPALRHIHFHAERGECTVLCGKSGCGKTTMLRMVNGLVPNFYQGRLEGDITVGNVHIKEASLPQVAAVVGSVFQNPRTQFFHLDTTGEMAFNMENLNIPHDKMVERLKETAWKLDIQTLMDRDIFQLSGGEKQRISIARGFIRNAQILMMDEATAALDTATARYVEESILHLDDVTAIVVTHKLHADILKQYDEILVMKDGRIEEAGTFEELYARKGCFYSLYRLSV